MKSRDSSKSRFQIGFSLAVVAIAIGVLGASLAAGEEAKAKPVKPTQKKAEKKEKKLSGAELYALHCNRCHPERYATERTEAQWQTILLHMRARANLPAEQARTILKYLQQDSGK